MCEATAFRVDNLLARAVWGDNGGGACLVQASMARILSDKAVSAVLLA